MTHKTFPLQSKYSLKDSRMVTYILDGSVEIDPTPRPLVILCPGGGYEYTSDREAEPVALAFNAQGFHAVVIRYSCAPATYPVAITEVALAMSIIKKNAKKWNVDTNKILIQGASAGGHLALSYALFCKEREVLSDPVLTEALTKNKQTADDLTVNGVILSYPVVTSGTFAHRGSIENLLGKPYDTLSDHPLFKKMSLETQIPKDFVPVFLWHTFTDDCVPAENSILLVTALKKKNIPTEFHLFPAGGHGLGLANEITKIPGGYGVQKECQIWIDLAADWIRRL